MDDDAKKELQSALVFGVAAWLIICTMLFGLLEGF
jgi:hypothetical protein